MKPYLVYYDSGTSNSRIYLLDREFRTVYTARRHVGSRDSAAAGSNRVLLEGLWALYRTMLRETGTREEDIQETICASGMITSAYGLTEVPHLETPASAERLARNLASFREDTLFHREFLLVPGLKTAGEEIAQVNNMRGEEVEIIGALDTLAERWPDRKVALILPGSHTHSALIDRGEITGILSTMTGELFHALKSDTILSPVLSIPEREIDGDMVRLGAENAERWGFNRALYIGHAMRTFQRGTPAQRKSYCEGVINGGAIQALARLCAGPWAPCSCAVIVSDEYQYALCRALLERQSVIREIGWLPISREKSYAVKGLRTILAAREK